MTVIGQKYLPINLNFLANSGAIWLIPAFLVSYLSKTNPIHSILLCIICLLCCVLGYYGFEAVLNSHAFELGFYTYVWIACAFIGGTIFGLGAYCANYNNGWLKYCGQNLLPAVFLAEGINKIIHIDGYMHMIPAVVMVTLIGVALYFVINRHDCLKKKNLSSIVVITAFGLIGFEIISQITM